MFDASSDLYDLIYAAFKDYPAEAAAVAGLLRTHHPGCHSVLDVGCGTGTHARLLAGEYGFAVDGLDRNADFVRIATAKHPGGRFYPADMRDFHLPQRYDAVISLFSSIGYVMTTDALAGTLACFAEHLAEGGIVVVEPWFEPGALTDGYVVTHSAETEGLRVVRTSRTEIVGRTSRLHFTYEVETADDVKTLHEEHELGLFTEDEMRAGFHAAGLTVAHDPVGLTGRGLYVARRRED